MRFVVGAVVVLAWAFATRTDLRVRRGEWAPLIVVGLLFAVQLAFLNIGINFTTAGNSVVLTVTFPIWVAVLSHFFIPGDRLTVQKTIGVIAAYAGVVLLFADSLGVDRELLLGDILTAISGFLLATRQVYSSRIVQNLHPAKLLLAQAILGTVSFVIASAIFEPEPYVWTGRLIIAVLYQGAVIAGFGFIGQLWLIERYFPSQVTVISLTQPIFGIVAAWLILGEPLKPVLWISAVLVIMGAGLVQRSRMKSSSTAGGRERVEPARRAS